MKTILRVSALLGVVGSVVAAQNPPVAQPAQPRPGVQRRAGQMAQPNRADLEQRVRDRIGVALKTNLKLTDDQFAKLQATNKRFEEKRRLLVEQERDARMGMRDLMISGDTTNQSKVSQGLDRMLQVQAQRQELMAQEQKELAGYLTPMQRARYLGMQEQMFRRMEAMRAQRGGGMRQGGPPMGNGMGRGGMRPGAMQPGMGPGMGQGMGQGMGGMRAPQGPPPPAKIPPA